MKKSIIAVSAAMLFYSHAKAVNLWEGVYEFDNGARIIRMPTGLRIQDRGLSMEVGEDYYFGKGSQLGRLIARADGSLSINQDQTQFQKELLKLGKIRTLNGKNFNAFGTLVKKRMPVDKKASSTIKKRTLVTKRSAAAANRS